jgi:hypothetical protein
MLDFVDAGDPSAGLACITGVQGLGISTVGGLRSILTFFTNADRWVGCVDHEPSGPRRQAGPLRAPTKMARWATQQSECLATHTVSEWQRLNAATAVAGFEGDATAIAVAQLDGAWQHVTDISETMKGGNEFYAPADHFQWRDGKIILSNTSFLASNSHSYSISESSEKRFLLRTIEVYLGLVGILRDRIALYKMNTIGHDILSIMSRHLQSQGYMLDITPMENIVFAEYIGTPNERDGLVRGTLLQGPGLKLSARKIGT